MGIIRQKIKCGEGIDRKMWSLLREERAEECKQRVEVNWRSL
jgi:hypothetical protein